MPVHLLRIAFEVGDRESLIMEAHGVEFFLNRLLVNGLRFLKLIQARVAADHIYIRKYLGGRHAERLLRFRQCLLKFADLEVIHREVVRRREIARIGLSPKLVIFDAFLHFTGNALQVMPNNVKLFPFAGPLPEIVGLLHTLLR